MSILPTPSQIAGKHYQLYEAYLYQLPKNPDGSISAMEGAKLLKRSGLTDAILSKIWDMSDPQSRGCLDKSGLFMSLKLITLAQTGRDVNMSNALQDIDEVPEMSGEKPIIRPLSAPTAPVGGLDPIGEDMMANFQKMFLVVAEPNPVPGQAMCVPGNKAKGMMLESKLPVEVLGKIWDMADTNKDGALDEPEFIIALHLVQTVKKGGSLPPSLPPDFINTVRRGMKGSSPKPPRQPSLVSSPDLSYAAPAPIAPPPTMPIMPPVQQQQQQQPLVPPQQQPVMQAPVQQQPIDGWIVSQDDRIKYGNLFLQTDKDRDGFISGLEIKDLFLQSGIPQPILAHIWNLCDDSQQGKLNREQFILAMWLIQRKVVQNIDPPQVLPQEMRIPGADGTSSQAGDEVNPEFELIMKEIMELVGEKNNLECEILSKESEKKVKTGEMKSLQSEFDTLAATLKQLENQKNVANTKLSDLENQVNSLRSQADSQESTLVEQETELSTKRHELTSIDTEMTDNEKEQKDITNKLDTLTDLQQQTQLKISKLRTQINDLHELENTMRSCLIKYDDCIENNNWLAGVVETDLRDLGLEFDEICDAYTEIKTPTAKEPPPMGFQESFHEDSNNMFENGGSKFEAQFDSSPFESKFEDTAINEGLGFSDDPFAVLRPETAPSWPVNKPNDPFAPVAAPLGGKSPGGFEKDPFGAEPFSNSGGGGGPNAPNLPPKKPPPPRPAPPKNAPARPPPPKATPSPAPSASSDAFGGSEGGFADFANFDSAGLGGFSSSAWTSTNSSISKSRPSGTSSSLASPWGDAFTSNATPSSFSAATLPSPTTNNFSSGRSRSTRSSKMSFNGNGNSGSMSTNNLNAGGSSALSRTTTSQYNTGRSVSNLDFTEDPFKNYRYEDPFALGVDPFSSSNNNSSNNVNNGSTKGTNSNSNSFGDFNFNNNFDPFK